ncbi:MAG: hypothetical protein EBT94_13395 [Alphaproteobacteria bacterium]|nr:hypothetical protein [Alphaproteobacteria bacterium]
MIIMMAWVSGVVLLYKVLLHNTVQVERVHVLQTVKLGVMLRVKVVQRLLTTVVTYRLITVV